ncbi:MAG: hypothetical protein ACKVOE_03070 [Rickettsiales bacterium]
MTSKREQVLNALYTAVKSLEGANLKVYRNLDKPQPVPSAGLVVLRDGTGEEPEVLLSPLTYIYEHIVTLEAMIQNASSAARDTALDALLVNIGAIINANRTLGGLAEWVEARSPDFADEPIEGAASVRLATVGIMIRFSTIDPLN